MALCCFQSGSILFVSSLVESCQSRRLLIAGIDYLEQHENFTPGVTRGVITNDIGVIRLKRPIVFNQYVQPACLPQEPSPVDRTVYVSGWGITRGEETI